MHVRLEGDDKKEKGMKLGVSCTRGEATDGQRVCKREEVRHISLTLTTYAGRVLHRITRQACSMLIPLLIAENNFNMRFYKVLSGLMKPLTVRSLVFALGGPQCKNCNQGR